MKQIIIKKDTIDKLVNEKDMICISPKEEYSEELMKEYPPQNHLFPKLKLEPEIKSSDNKN